MQSAADLPAGINSAVERRCSNTRAYFRAETQPPGSHGSDTAPWVGGDIGAEGNVVCAQTRPTFHLLRSKDPPLTL